MEKHKPQEIWWGRDLLLADLPEFQVIEPEISLRNGKQRELFGVTLYTPVAEEMLLERQYRSR